MSDILVIGGGIAGVSAAARLAHHAKVTLLEAESALGYHASGRSAAVYEPNYGAASVNALSHAGRNYFEEGSYLSPRGLMLLARAHEHEAFLSDVAGMGCECISLDEARAMVPVLAQSVRYAALHADAQDIDTDRLIQDFAHALRTHGGTIRLGLRVTNISHSAGTWSAIAANGETFSAEVLVNAGGAWADQIARLAGVEPIGLTPCRRSMARIPAPGGHDVSRWPMFFGPGETWYAKPDAGALIVSPAEEEPTEPQEAWAEDMTIAEGIDRYQGFVSEDVTRVLATWAGLRTFAPDRTLVLGPDPSQPAFVWCAGQGGYGMQTAPGASKLLADLTLGQTPDFPAETIAALSPKRFR